MDRKKEIFEIMPVPKALATLAVPSIISQVITLLYNLADTWFIGQTGDPLKVAAVSLTFMLYFSTNALANLFGVGGGSLISRLLGKGSPEEARKVSAFSFYGTILVAGTYSLLVYLFMEPLLYLLGASENTLDYAASYTFWVVVVGAVPATLSATMGHLLRSEGYAKQASFGLSLGAVMNILLDPLFMFVLMPEGLEVTGAAVATMLSSVISLLFFGVMFAKLRTQTVLSVSPDSLSGAAKYAGEVISVGFPSSLSSILSSVATSVLFSLTAGYGDIPLAAMGIVRKIDMLPMNMGMGLCQGMMPLVAYNYAAGNYRRMRDSAGCARICGMGFAAVCITVYEIFAETLIRLFIDDAQTVEAGVVFLRICCLAVPLMICNFQMTYTFQAMGKGRESLFLAACRQGLINIPMLFLMNSLFGMTGLAWNQLLSDGITMVIAFVLYRKINRELKMAGV